MTQLLRVPLTVASLAFALAIGRELAAQATRHYAKRQLTWFRKEQGAELVKPPYDLAFPLPS